MVVDLPLHVGPGLCLCPVLVGATRLVPDSLCWLLLCLTACRRRDKGGQMALYQQPPYDPASIHNCHTTCIPHYPLGQWVAQLAS